MPQKKNPDMAELIRGKAGRVIGDLVGLLVALKGLPLAYNKDMQEDKEPLFDALATWHDCLTAMADMMERAQWQKKALAAALDRGFLLATDLADALVRAGVPFRVAHEQIAELVADLTRDQLTFDKYGAKRLAERLQLPEAIAKETLDIQKALRRRDIPGAPHPKRVKAAARDMQKRADKLEAQAVAKNQPCPAERLLRGL